MLDWYQIYLFAFLAGSGLALALTPLFQRLALKLGFLDCPRSEQHKGHYQPTPLLGGGAMFCAWLLALGSGYALLRWGGLRQFSADLTTHLFGLQAVGPKLGVLILAAALIVLMGVIDDRWPLRAGVKFLIQFLVAAIAVTWGGVRISFFIDSSILTWIITVFWYMLLFNAINFFDNMDGLAVGTITIAMALFTTVAAMNNQFFVAAFAALNCGVGLGFWFYNHSPATIFMGDSGSHFLGFLAATTSVLVSYYYPNTTASPFAILVPFFILAVPLFDTLAVIIIRWRLHKPFWIGDHNHISHRFTKMGLSRRCAVLLVHLLTLTIGIGVLPVLWGGLGTAIILISQALLLLFIISLLQFLLSFPREKKVSKEKRAP